MKYAVISYPKISKIDFDFVQNYRKVNDPKYFSMVDPHITFVFPIPNFSESEFIDEVARQSAGTAKFDFTIRCAMINQDASGEFFHEFLVPDEGYSHIVKLHDKLYSGKFFDNLRFDIDFIPHIGIGNSENVLTCKKNIDDLNSQSLIIEGSVQVLDIVKYENDKIETVETIELI